MSNRITIKRKYFERLHHLTEINTNSYNRNLNNEVSNQTGVRQYNIYFLESNDRSNIIKYIENHNDQVI